ncbi:MAG: replication initiation protein [Bacteroidota bacterium]
MNYINNLARIENNFIFNAQYQLTAKEQKVILLLIANINPIKQQNFQKQLIPVKALKSVVMGQNTKGSFYQEMKKLAFRLVKKGISFDTDVLIEGRPFPGYINWFQSIAPLKNEKGEVCLEFLFSEGLKPFLLQLHQYVQIDLQQLTKLGSGFSIHLFQIFQAQRNRLLKHKKHTKLTYQLPELKKTLGIANKYDDWRNFKRKVVDLAVQEINQHTHLRIDFRVIKKDGKVFSIEFELLDKASKHPSPTLSFKLDSNALTFAQVKALKILTDYRVAKDIALEMINRVKGSEIVGFEDWYFEEVIRIFEAKTIQKTATAKTGTLVNWFLKKRIFEQGDHFAVIMQRLQGRKKQLQNDNPTAWENRLAAKKITANSFRMLISRNNNG